MLAIGGVLPALTHQVPIDHATSAPRAYLCQGWRTCDALGYSSYHYAVHMWHAYWRMSPGNECTNYAAFVEATVYHAKQPSFLLGNGGQWAATAAAHGIPVNGRPAVGAVAEWDAGAPGIGGFGHVAVVEEVGPHDSYIVVSQQDMAGALDDYNWIKISARAGVMQWQQWPSHFIHFAIPARANLGYLNPRSDTVSLRDSQTRGPVNFTGQLPIPLGTRVQPLIGDWRGTGLADMGFYTPKYGTFHLLAARKTRTGLANLTFPFGPHYMIPLVGDWTGTGRDGIGYYNPAKGTFTLRAGRPEVKFSFGPPHMIPLVGNWIGGRRDEVGFYNPNKGTFTLRDGLGSGPVYRSFRFGPPHMIPVVGNWNVGAGDGVGYYDPATGTFYLRIALSKGPADETIRFGPPRMTPLAGDWFGEPGRG
jgi:surface antigen